MSEMLPGVLHCHGSLNLEEQQRQQFQLLLLCQHHLFQPSHFQHHLFQNLDIHGVVVLCILSTVRPWFEFYYLFMPSSEPNLSWALYKLDLICFRLVYILCILIFFQTDYIIFSFRLYYFSHRSYKPMRIIMRTCVNLGKLSIIG